MSEQTNQEKEPYSLSVFFGDVLDILEAGALSVFVFLMLFAFTMRLVTVDGGSMNPTLYNNDKLIILTPLLPPHQGDIIVIDDQEGGKFADPEQTVVYRDHGLGKNLIKRLIAREGSELDINFDTGEVKVDGVVLDEPYIADPTRCNDGAFTYPLTVPEGYVFVMGDNRMNSTDSRSPAVGLIPKEEILGTAIFRYEREEEHCTKWTDKFAFLY